MKASRLAIPVLGLLVTCLALATPALGHIVEVTTFVPLAEVRDTETLKTAVTAAAERARAEAIAFKPSVMAVTGVRVVGDRVLIGLLFADDDGKAMLEALQRAPGGDDGSGPGDGPTDERDGKLKI
jgi:hypothetical protein